MWHIYFDCDEIAKQQYQHDLDIMQEQQDYGSMINMIGKGRYNELCSASMMVQINSFLDPTNIKIYTDTNVWR